MLYDQALVSSIYLDGLQGTERPELKKLFGEKARGIFDYVLRDLRSPEDAFYSSEDADSEGMEGKFYVWTLDEVLEIAGEEAGRWFASHYDVTELGNWDHPGDAHVPAGPKNILQVDRPIEVIAKLNDLDPEKVEKAVAEVRQKLFEAREKRVRPGLDDKILTGWNGLMIAALAKGAAVLDEHRYGDAAARGGRLHSRRHAARPPTAGYLRQGTGTTERLHHRLCFSDRRPTRAFTNGVPSCAGFMLPSNCSIRPSNTTGTKPAAGSSSPLWITKSWSCAARPQPTALSRQATP